MGVSLLARLVEAGTPPDLIAEVALLVAETQRKRTQNAERQAKLRAGRAACNVTGEAEPRNVTQPESNVTAPCNVTAAPTKPSSLSLLPREEKKEDRSLRSLDAREGASWPHDAFDQFWGLYPNKVGKPKAEASLKAARKRGFDFAEIMAGLRRYVAKTDNREWCNPTTWVNQQRWLDEPGTPPPARAGPQAGRNGHHGTSKGQHGGTLADGIDIARRYAEQLSDGGNLFSGRGGPSGVVPAGPVPAIGYRKP